MSSVSLPGVPDCGGRDDVIRGTVVPFVTPFPPGEGVSEPPNGYPEYPFVAVKFKDVELAVIWVLLASEDVGY